MCGMCGQVWPRHMCGEVWRSVAKTHVWRSVALKTHVWPSVPKTNVRQRLHTRHSHHSAELCRTSRAVSCELCRSSCMCHRAWEDCKNVFTSKPSHSHQSRAVSCRAVHAVPCALCRAELCRARCAVRPPVQGPYGSVTSPGPGQGTQLGSHALHIPTETVRTEIEPSDRFLNRPSKSEFFPKFENES
jgi:hypothetical protein